MTEGALGDALLLTLRIFAVGIAWSRPLSEALKETVPPGARHLAAGAAALIAGTAVNLLLFLALGEAGLCREPVLTASLLAAVAAGSVLTLAGRAPGRTAEHVAGAVPGAAVFLLAAAFFFLLPARGEWVVGGWDPGVYINEGVALRNEGTFHPADPVFAGELDNRGKSVFSRSLYGRTERFPGVVTEPGTGSMSFEFFRLTPAMIALVHSDGGGAALRVNALLAAAAIGLFAIFLLQSTGAAHALMASILLLLQPILLYHTHVPVSEMLQLFLLMAFAVTLATRRRRSGLAALLQGALLLLLVLNRFSFLPFAGLLIAVLAWFDIGRSDRRQVLVQRLLQVGGAAAGAGIDSAIAPWSLRSWAHLPKMYAVFAAGAAAALFIDALCARESWRNRLVAAREALRWGPALAAAALPALVIFGSGFFVRPQDADNLLRLVAYVGPAPVLLSVAGAVLMVIRRGRLSDDTKVFLLFLAAVTAVLVTKKWIVDIYPWATRRHLAYTLPLVAVLAAWPPALIWHSSRGRGAVRAVACAIIAVTALSILPRSWHAWSRVEYEGARAMIAAVATETAAGSVIVADAPRWGTPLRFLHGRQVLDGKHLWRFGRKRDSRLAVRALRDLRRGGGKIRFLTSTERGIDIYPHELGRFTLDWESEPFSLQEIAHGPAAGDFVLRSREYRLRVYTWEGP